MPQQRGRKRRIRERRRGTAPDASTGESAASGTDVHAAGAPVVRAAGPGSEALPSSTARVTGFMIALVTAVGAAVMIYGGLTGDSAAVNATARVVGGIAMLVIAVVVGALAIAPGVVRDVVRRKKSEE